ncbi:MAG: Vault protein inter-alpha-trypsin domain-containing protein [Desulfatitalea sp. BRH_c12]|nr:MAG: Vault protein inter-alpha-trypsin domain-containing protein [Desulfatitalea sp. BRH_c12]
MQLFAQPPVLAESHDTGKTLAPYFYIENGDEATDDFPLKKTDVTVAISGVMADVTVLQKYYNAGTRPISANYIFPASTRAAVHAMSMTIGEKVIHARIEEKKAAEKTFTQAKKEGKQASLLQQHRPNVFSMNVANIMPGDEIAIRLHYCELLTPENGTYAFVFPTVVGPRYANVPEAAAGTDDIWVKNPYLQEDRPTPSAFDIRVHLATGIPLQEVRCDTHATEIGWNTSASCDIELSATEQAGADRDFIVNYRLAGKQIESGLMLYEGENERFFALMMAPPERIATDMIVPREYIFVVDVSGSMYGFPLDISKQLITDLIGSLGPNDRFNVVLFAGDSRVMAPASVAAGPENVNRALKLIDSQAGGGGTELAAAMDTALALPATESMSRTLVVVTDGYIAAEKEVFTRISRNLGNANMFAFGIGSSVNRHLIEGMARAGLGEPFVITEPGKATAAARQFREYIQYPLMSDIRVSCEDFETYDVEPRAIPDLFAGRPIVVFGKWRGKKSGTITITGTTGAQQYARTFSVADAVTSENHMPLRYLWARTRLMRLSDFPDSGDQDEVAREITSLGLTYHLLTRYTSFVAVSETIANPSGQSRDTTQPLPLPKGVSALAIGTMGDNAFATVPEPEMIFLIVPVVGMIAITFWRRRKSRGVSTCV